MSFPFDVPESPMEELPPEVVKIEKVVVGTSPDGRLVEPSADGWYSLDCVAALVFPAALSKAIIGRKNPTLVVDIGTDQQETPRTLSVAKFPHGKGPAELGVCGRIYTLPGKYDAQRYAWRMKLDGRFAEDDVLFILSREGGKARYRINSVRCFVSGK